MRDEYDFSNGVRNPYARPTKSTVTIRLDKSTIDYFKSLSDEVNALSDADKCVSGRLCCETHETAAYMERIMKG